METLIYAYVNLLTFRNHETEFGTYVILDRLDHWRFDGQLKRLYEENIVNLLLLQINLPNKMSGWGQIDAHCWPNMTSQLITQCCRGWSNFPTCSVQQFVIMCVEQCWGVCQTNIHLLFVEQQIKFILLLFVLSFSFGRIAQLVAHSLHKPEFPGSNPRHPTWQSFSSFQCMMIFCLPAIFIFLFTL